MNDFEYIDVDKIELDKSNPRIADYLNNYPEVSAEAISLALGAGRDTEDSASTTFSGLQKSILAYGGIINPIIVRKTSENKYVAIEGNTRLCIYKEFAKENRPGNWTKIKAICHGQIDEEHIDIIRLQAHLVGPRPWDPYAKAKYLFELYSQKGMTLDELLPFCGGSASEIKAMIDAFKDVENYFRPVLAEKGMLFQPKKFSAFRELQNKRVQDALTRAGYTKTDFAKWVADENIDTMQGPRALPKVLNDKEATAVFLRKNITEAKKILNAKEVTGDNNLSKAKLFDLVVELDNRLSMLPYPEYQRIMQDPDKDLLRSALSSLSEGLKIYTELE